MIWSINPKPAPDIYLKTVQTLHVEPRLAVALEDSEPGCRAAKQAGLKAMAIPNRFSERQDLTRCRSHREERHRIELGSVGGLGGFGELR